MAETTLDTLAAQIEKGFAAVAGDIADIRRDMATKDDVRTIMREEVPGMIREELKPIHHELSEINRRLDVLDEEYKNLKGVTKEIDEIRDQVRAIEKHLGLNKKIAA